MKKALLLTLGVLAMASASAATYSFVPATSTFTASTYTEGTKTVGELKGSWTSGGQTFTVDMKGFTVDKNGNQAESSKSVDMLKWYKNVVMTLDIPEAAGKVTSIVLHCANNVSKGAWKYAGVPTNMSTGWTGTITECATPTPAEAIVTLTNEGANQFVGTSSIQTRVKKIDIITNGEGGGSEPEPDPEPAGNVKVDNIAAFLAGADATATYEFTSPMTAVYQFNTGTQYNLWVQDATGGTLIYGNTNLTFAPGEQVAAGMTGQYKDFKGTIEVVNPSKVAKAATTAEVVCTPVAVTDLEAAMVNQYVELTGVNIVAEGSNFYATTDEGRTLLFDKFKIGVAAGENMTVKGIVAIFKNVPQIYPIVITDASGEVVEVVATPTFSPVAGAVEAGTKVTIACATEGAKIYYTTDNTEPTTASTLFEGEGIEVTAAMTIKAIAVKEGMENSKVATAAYTIAAEDPYKGKFNSFNGGKANSSYGTYTNASGWEATNACILGGSTKEKPSNPYFAFIGGDEVRAVCLNGKTANVGKVVSPTLTGGLGTLTFDYGYAFSETNGVSLTINVKQDGQVVATDVLENKTLEKATVAQYEHAFNVEGDFVIEIVNNCPSAVSDKNKDRTAIWNLTWTEASSGVEAVEAAEAEGEVEYYNLQGIRVANPENGIYIRRQGTKVTKVLVK